MQEGAFQLREKENFSINEKIEMYPSVKRRSMRIGLINRQLFRVVDCRIISKHRRSQGVQWVHLHPPGWRKN